MINTKGILLAGGRGTRLAPITSSVNKHLIPIYDKPMIYYPLSTLMLCGIREIALITNSNDIELFEKLLGNGSRLGISITYFEQPSPNGIPEALQIASNYLEDSNSVLILGDNLLIGQGLGETLKTHLGRSGASILAFPVSNPSDYGVVELDNEGNVMSIEEKPQLPKSNYAIPGIYFFDRHAPKYAKELGISARGEYEITDLLKKYLQNKALEVSIVRRGTGWMDAGTVETLFTASELVRIFQTRQGLHFNVPEEIAFRQKWINKEQLFHLANTYHGTNYGNYLLSLN